MRLAIVASHPAQYQAPWFRGLARVTDLEVFYCHRQNASDQAAVGLGVDFEWDTPLFDGYCYQWLQNRSRRPGVSAFGGCDTPEIHSVLEAGRFDACIVNGWYLKSYLQAIWACKRLQIPVLSRSDSTLMTRRSTAWRALKHRPYRWLVRAIDGHLYAGQANLEYLRRYGVDADRLFFVPHFVDNEFFSAGARSARQSGGAAAVRAAHGIPADATVFIVVGTLLERKRHVDFLDALDRLRRDLPGVWGLVVGAGPLEHHLKSVAAQRNLPVRFAGFQNQSQLPEHYAAADAIVLPSSADETWGLVVNEAMACGLPAIVSSGCGCSRDVIDANRTGLVFPVGDVAALSSAMRWLTDLLKTGRRAIHDAVAAKIAQYGCSAAVAGTQVALHAVTRQRRHAAPAQPVQT